MNNPNAVPTGKTRIRRESFPAIDPQTANAVGRPADAFTREIIEEEVSVVADPTGSLAGRTFYQWRRVGSRIL